MQTYHCHTCDRDVDSAAMTYHFRLGHSVGDAEERGTVNSGQGTELRQRPGESTAAKASVFRTCAECRAPLAPDSSIMCAACQGLLFPIFASPYWKALETEHKAEQARRRAIIRGNVEG